jgi:hypothetical protein
MNRGKPSDSFVWTNEPTDSIVWTNKNKTVIAYKLFRLDGIVRGRKDRILM